MMYNVENIIDNNKFEIYNFNIKCLLNKEIYRCLRIMKNMENCIKMV